MKTFNIHKSITKYSITLRNGTSTQTLIFSEQVLISTHHWFLALLLAKTDHMVSAVVS